VRAPRPTLTTGGWIFLAVMRLFVGAGVSGLFTVDLPLVQEFVPTRCAKTNMTDSPALASGGNTAELD
jgi:hypothetical protein